MKFGESATPLGKDDVAFKGEGVRNTILDNVGIIDTADYDNTMDFRCKHHKNKISINFWCPLNALKWDN